MLIVDTSVWIDYFNGTDNWQANYLEGALSNETIFIGDLILAELLQGFKNDRDFKTVYEYLNTFECVTFGGKEFAIKVASNYRYIRSKGITVRKTVDMFIGTWCIENNAALLHNDKDFDVIASHLPLINITN
jgi:predicted nucleic acid-binding protein